MEDLNKKIEAAINSYRPFLQSDGGDVRFIGITADNVVKINLVGACRECNMSPSTLYGLEEAIKKAVPQVISVETISD
ncbi:MAG: NifU family protein [Flavobacteriales bacterium]|nr:NifU family protein [Flavobacteriales bacterium]